MSELDYLPLEISVSVSGCQKSHWQSLLEKAVGKLAITYILIY